MDTLKTLAIDITHSVFENDTAGILYVTKDIFSDSFIVAVPVIALSWEIRDDRDYKYLLESDVLRDRDKKEKLVQAIKEVITEF